MRIMRKPLNRRTILRGAGTVMALPFLEAMMPSAKAADIASRPKRLQVFYSPNGMMMNDFLPTTQGSGFDLPPILQPLAPHRAQLTVVSGLGHPSAAAMGDRPAGHGRSCPAFITGVHVKQTEGTDIRCGISLDQVYANHLG
ncbi:MAG: DUF1552 domain-containing protein, partial [bacterium]|nr:DUF1552 domain-containing protein [bacterium]